MKRVLTTTALRSKNYHPTTGTFATASRNLATSNEVTRDELVTEASKITRSLYRICLRSVNVIRHGNEFDEKEFQRRDEEFSNPKPGVSFSMAPPPNREDELRSRAEYYQSYAREYFIQESDCLDNDPLHKRDIKRYLYYVRKGDKDRKWLLADMMFPDPYKDSMDHNQIANFESLSKKYLGEEEEDDTTSTAAGGSLSLDGSNGTSSETKDYFDADDESPEWFKEKFPNIK